MGIHTTQRLIITGDNIPAGLPVPDSLVTPDLQGNGVVAINHGWRSGIFRPGRLLQHLEHLAMVGPILQIDRRHAGDVVHCVALLAIAVVRRPAHRQS